MGITIATQDRRFTLKVSEAESEKLFNHLVMEVIGDAGHVDATEPPVIPEDIDRPQEFKEQLPDTPDTPEESKAVATGYHGFMYIRCEHCGEVKGFCVKEDMKYYKCAKCGKNTELEDLIRLYLNCECGRRSVYWTNMIDDAFDVNCIMCGTPVSVKYNAKKNLYETMED